VNGVIQLNRAGIFRTRTKESEFRMPIFQASDVGRISLYDADGAQIGMAFGAGLIAGGDDVDAPSMFSVAFGAIRYLCFYLVIMMGRAVMAGEAGAVERVRGKFAGPLQVARGALLLQHGVRLAQSAAGIDARIMQKSTPSDPAEGH